MIVLPEEGPFAQRETVAKHLRALHNEIDEATRAKHVTVERLEALQSRVVALASAFTRTLSAVSESTRSAPDRQSPIEVVETVIENMVILLEDLRAVGLTDIRKVDLLKCYLTANGLLLKAVETQTSVAKAQVGSENVERWVMTVLAAIKKEGPEVQERILRELRTKRIALPGTR